MVRVNLSRVSMLINEVDWWLRSVMMVGISELFQERCNAGIVCKSGVEFNTFTNDDWVVLRLNGLGL